MTTRAAAAAGQDAAIVKIDDGAIPSSENGVVAEDAAPADPMDGIPELATYLAVDYEEKLGVLKLVADSIAQQRQTAARAMIFHPATIGGFVLIMAIASHFLYKEFSDWPIMFTTGVGVIMAFMAAIKWAGGPYLEQAESMRWTWLDNDVGVQDDMIVTQYGTEIIGAVVIRFVGATSSSNTNGKSKKSAKDKDHAPSTAQIRGWAVRVRYRNKGIGGDLLDEAVRHVHKKAGPNTTIEFAEDHANSFRPLPATYNRQFDRNEKMARARLEKALATAGVTPSEKTDSSVLVSETGKDQNGTPSKRKRNK